MLCAVPWHTSLEARHLVAALTQGTPLPSHCPHHKTRPQRAGGAAGASDHRKMRLALLLLLLLGLAGLAAGIDEPCSACTAIAVRGGRKQPQRAGGGGESQQRRARRTPHPDPEAASPLRAAAPPGPISLSERGSGSKRPPAARAGARRNLGLAPAGRRTTRCLNTPFPQAELQRRLDAEKPRNHLDLRHRLDKHGKRYGKVRCGARLRRVVAGTARTRTQQRRAACCSCRTAAAVPGRSMHADQ